MQLVLELLAAAALLFSMAVLWRDARRRFFTPVRPPRGAAVYTVVTASGSGDGLEQLIASLLWLHTSAGLSPYIIIEDHGLSDDGAAVARLLERDSKAVVVVKDAAVAPEKTGV